MAMFPGVSHVFLPALQGVRMEGYYSQMTHTCNYCNKILPTYGDLVQHKKTHVGERPFSCHICHKRFTQKAHLNIHKRTHTGEKPYACPICHKRFAQSSHLNSHRRIHADDRPYFCVVCNTGFSQKHRFDAHLPCMQQAKSRSSARISAALSSAAAASAAGAMGPYRGLEGDLEVDQKPDIRYLDSLSQQALMQQLAEFSAASDSSPGISKGGGGGEGEMDRDSMMGGAIQGPSPPREESKMDMLGSSPILAASSHRRKPAYVRHVDSEDGGGGGADPGDLGDRAGEGGGVAVNGAADLLSMDHSDPEDGKDEVQVHFQNGGGRVEPHQASAAPLPGGPLPANQALLPTRLCPVGPGKGLDTAPLQAPVSQRISLVNFTVDELLQHLMCRGDVHRCDFCQLVFRDAAMYHMHRNMHDKHDLRRCNFCGKMLHDRYDFTAHFLNEHR